MHCSPHTLIRTDILEASSYAVPCAEGFIKLDAMENPFTLPATLAQELGQRLGEAALNRYPAPRPLELIEKIKRTMHVAPGCDVLLGNGSDEIISLLMVACAKPGAKVIAPVPGFVMFELLARQAQIEFIGVPLLPDFSLDQVAMQAAIKEHAPALIFLANPNNPTGTLYNEAEIEQLIRAAPSSLVVMDEAYGPFSPTSWMPRLQEFDNVLLMRTFSKLGLAGIRLGYLAGSPQWLTQLDKVRPPYNINVLTQIASSYALDHIDVLNAQAQQLCSERARLSAALSAQSEVGKTITVYPSAGNFLLVRVPDASFIFESLLKQRILVKNVSAAHPLLHQCLRLTIGRPEENDQLIKGIHTALSAMPTSRLG